MLNEKQTKALCILREIRSHVARNGVTGGNPQYGEDMTVCPRGLVTHFGQQQGETSLNLYLQPEGTAARIAMDALGAALPEDVEDRSADAVESHWRRMQYDGTPREEQVAHIDAAIRNVEFSGPPMSSLDRLIGQFERPPLRGNITGMSRDEMKEALRDIRATVGEIRDEQRDS